MRKVPLPGLLPVMLCILVLSLVAPLTAQVTFIRTYGGTDSDGGRSVAQTTDGGYIITGWTRSFGAGDADVYLVRTDARGDTLWTRTYGGTDSDRGLSVTQTADSGYVIAGYAKSFGAGSSDVYLVKTDASGDTIWTRTYGGSYDDYGYSVAQTADGGYIIAGETWSFGAGSHDFWLIKTDASGDTIWTRTYGGTLWDKSFSVAQTVDDGYVIAGFTMSFAAGMFDVYLVKTDAAGDTMWTRTYGGDSSDSGRSVVQTADGGYVITGCTNSFGVDGDNVWLIKTDAAGDTIWTRTYGDTWPAYGYSVAQTADGGYIISGWTGSFGTYYSDVYLIKTDAAGDTMWTRTWGGTAADKGYSVAQTTDGGYAVAGYTASFGAGASDVWLIKTDSAGRVAVAIAEPQPPVAHKPAPATIARGVLHMPETEMTNARYPITLLDVAGRKAMNLKAGTNDVRHLAPGVYFVRGKGPRVQGSEGSSRKVILTR